MEITRLLLSAMAAAGVCTGAGAQEAGPAQGDSLKTERLQEAVVSSVRASGSAPFATSDIDGAVLINFSRTAQEIPFLIARTPGVLAWSENGLGSGTSYMRIRGAGDSRINVTLDGVPLNSPEDQCVFWANMGGYASMLGSIQIQRGVGGSTNGDGAFGGTVSLSSKSLNPNHFVELTGSYGSYNTWRGGLSFSTGLLGRHVVVDGAYQGSGTDGYVHGTAGNSGSFYGGIGFIGANFQIRYRLIGNYEHTGQAWNGIEIGGMKTYDEVWKAGLGLYNSLVESYDVEQDGRVKFIPYTWKDGQIWRRTTDNFTQFHNILSGVWEIDENLRTTLSLHYTRGGGYYEELKPSCKLTKFGLQFTDSAGNVLKKTDFVRQKGLTQNTGGGVWSIAWNAGSLHLDGGLNLQYFGGNHYGYLTYVAHPELGAKLLDSSGRYNYYNSDASKFDASAFVKAAWTFAEHWNIFGDLQYRFVSYTTNGKNDKWDSDLVQHILDVKEKYNFFNPKAGISYINGGHKAYFSYARSNREPERNNFTDNGHNPFPRPESLNDFELGYSYHGKIWHAGANLYYMGYRDQFVQTGQISDIGENLTTNIKDSYRTGIELVAGVDVLPWMSLEANAALSRNRLRDFDEYTETYTVDWEWVSETVVHYDDAPLAFSPDAIVNGFVDFHTGGFKATWHTSYVSRMYLDNTGSTDRSLPGHSVSDLSASYTFNLGRAVKTITAGINLGNIFNHHYAAAGYAWSNPIKGNDPKGERLQGVGFIPQAGFTAIGNVTIRF